VKNRLIFLSLIFAVVLKIGFCASDIFLLEIDGTINPIVADHISKGLKEAVRRDAHAVIIKMDTPGGLMDSMRQIIKSMEAVPYPVIVYIGDAGARAASAGAFITLASDIAVMARGTNIGAAHPVQMGEQKITEDMSKKMAEDARAFIKSLAEKHNRNADWAQKAVTESVSITSSEAVKLNVVEYEVKDFDELKSTLEGKVITKNGKEFKLSFENEIIKIEMPFFKKLLNYISHPNFAYVLLILGVYGLIYEFSNPGIGLGAVFGGISLLLAALAFQMIPVNVVGMLLIIFGIILMFTDIWVPSYGILTIGGLISFLIGSLTLFDVERFPVSISLGLILGATVTTALFFIFAAGSGIKIQRKKVTTGQKGMIGLEGEVRKTLSPRGEVFVRGEIWEAESIEGKMNKGTAVEVVDIKGNLLVVKKK
jgi:membrane-bound serine protease (ClpP class)